MRKYKTGEVSASLFAFWYTLTKLRMLNSSWDAVVREKEAITVFGLCQRPRTHFLLFFQFFPMQAQFFKFQLCLASSLLGRAGAALSR